MKRGDVLRGKTPKVRMGCGNVYITVNARFGDPIEVFIRLGKSGGCQSALLQGVARLVSIALQAGTPPEKIAKTLSGIACPEAPPGERPGMIPGLKGPGTRRQGLADEGVGGPAAHSATGSGVPASCLDALSKLLSEAKGGSDG